MKTLLSLSILGLFTTGCGVTQTERWDADVEVIETPSAPEIVESRVEGTHLHVSISQPVIVKKRPIERLTMLYEKTFSDVDWEGVGGVFLIGLGGAIIVGSSVAGGVYIGR
ncbi:hypothetical protein OAU50_00680 [Planctomycetota bacterium]|nr:hypothetical protein [Planctomycetota bacterium]